MESQQSDLLQSAQVPQMPQCYSSLIVWHIEAILALETNRSYACCDSCEEAVEEILEPLQQRRVRTILETLCQTKEHYIDDEKIAAAPEPEHRRTTTLS